jgi:hypothetical protein
VSAKYPSPDPNISPALGFGTYPSLSSITFNDSLSFTDKGILITPVCGLFSFRVYHNLILTDQDIIKEIL